MEESCACWQEWSVDSPLPHGFPLRQAMPRQRGQPAGLIGHEGDAVAGADEKARALEGGGVVGPHEGGQGAKRYGQGAQVQCLGAGGDFFQAAAVLKAVDHVVIVQRGQADVVAFFAVRLAVGADDVGACGGEGCPVDADIGVQVHAWILERWGAAGQGVQRDKDLPTTPITCRVAWGGRGQNRPRLRRECKIQVRRPATTCTPR